MKTVFRILVLLVIIGAGAWRARAYMSRKADPIPVTVLLADVGPVEESVTNSRSGTVKTRRQADLSPEAGGRVEQLTVHNGDHVREGQVLIRLADADYLAQLALQRRSVEGAHANQVQVCQAVTQIGRELARVQELATRNLVAQQQLDDVRDRHDTAVAACDAAGAQLKQAEASVALAEVSLTKMTLKAPFDGVVSKVATELGEWIMPAPPGVPVPPIIQIVDASHLYVSAELDEAELKRVRPNMPARVTIAAQPGESLPGKVARVGGFVHDVQGQSRTFEIEVELNSASQASALIPGSSADVTVVLNLHEKTLRIPTHALIQGDRVLTVRNGRLATVPVKTGLSNWQFTELRSGLKPGDPVVVSLDRAGLTDGTSVTIEPETKP